LARSSYPSPPEMTIDPSRTYTATIRTNKGDITAKLFADEAPTTVNNFVFLAREGFYDDVIFHRVIAGFMIQGGDPTGTGTGGPGYRFDDELEAARARGYRMGTLAMANAGPNTNGSQFFIMHQDYGLPPQYNVFGKAIDGLDVVDAIATTPTSAGDRPIEDVVIRTIDIDEA
jgi:cyclophilin family peptidyl-prolyl cis-trans isomerase